MAKAQDARKEKKKEPVKTTKEKKAAKEEKKQARARKDEAARADRSDVPRRGARLRHESHHLRVVHQRHLAWPAADALLLCVEDNGKGIASAEHHQIFDKFFQAQHQTMRKPEGSGLGLAITKKIVELHQGRIWVESAPDQGARFFVELPLVAPQRAAAPFAPSPSYSL